MVHYPVIPLDYYPVVPLGCWTIGPLSQWFEIPLSRWFNGAMGCGGKGVSRPLSSLHNMRYMHRMTVFCMCSARLPLRFRGITVGFYPIGLLSHYPIIPLDY